MLFSLPAKTVLVAAMMLTLSSPAQQFYRTELSAPMPAADSVQQRNLAEEKKLWTEIPEKRTLNSRTYITPSGTTMIEQCARPINYYVNGKLEPIDATIQSSEDDDGWAAMNQPFPVYVGRSGAYALTSASGQLMMFGGDASYNDQVKENPEYIASENQVLFYNVAPGVHRQLDIRENGVKASFIIPQPIPFNTGSTIVGEEIVLPEGFTIYLDPDRGEMKEELWYGDITIRNEKGEQEACIRQLFCFDNANAILKCGYSIEKDPDDNSYVLGSYIPGEWLNDAARQFPIVIDPLVTGPLAQWTGGFIPSCLMPQFSQDSILVTIPGQITVTGLFVTGSYYADPFSTAIMADGAMYFSTDCNQTQQFTVAPPNGNLPGTAYLLSFDMRLPLTCCWPQNCQQQQFWLSMHIGRTVGGSGCNTNFIYYDPNTQYPFTAYIEGHTVEYFGSGWSVPNNALCQDSCTITGTAQIRYGVPPYTISHPWMTGTVTAGTAAGCSFGNVSQQLVLAIPDCPQYCDTQATLVIPPPYVVDACGNVVIGLPTDNIPWKPVPVITSTPQQQTVCSLEQFGVVNTSCLPGTVITWTDGDTTGNFNFGGFYENLGATDTTVNFFVWGVLNGCYSDTVPVTVTIDPTPAAAFTVTNPAVAGMPVAVTDQSTTGANSITSWMYTTSTGDTIYTQNGQFIFNAPGIYMICLRVETGNNCTGRICDSIEVIPAEVLAPNVITPNGDGINDLLVFQFLEFYPDNQLHVYNRWGNMIYDQAHYTNDWNGSQFSDGTYYYVLSIQGKEEPVKGFFQLIR